MIRNIFVLIVGAAVLLGAGCSGDSSDSSTNQMTGAGDGLGTVTVSLATDGLSGAFTGARRADGDRGSVISAEISLSSLRARSSTSQDLVDVTLDFPLIVDLVALAENGGELDLGVGALPEDSYDKLVVEIGSLALATDGGRAVTIEPDGGSWTVPVNAAPFAVVADMLTTIRVEFRMSSFKFELTDDIELLDSDDFEPRFEADVDFGGPVGGPEAEGAGQGDDGA